MQGELARAQPSTGSSATKQRYGTPRRLLLTAALLLLIINPLVNYHFGFTFVQGWYQSLGIGELRLTSPLEGLESMLVTRQIHGPALIGMAIPLLLALLCGRVFCSWICPISFLAESLDSVRRLLLRKKVLHDRLLLAKWTLWFALIGEVLLSLIVGAPLFVFLSPPGLVGREIMMAVFFHTLAIEGVLLLFVLALELVTRRCYCRYFCPLGALLALVGRGRRLLILRAKSRCTGCGRCDQSCPMGLLPSQGESVSAYCWNCGECIDACSHQALGFHWRPGRTNCLPVE